MRTLKLLFAKRESRFLTGVVLLLSLTPLLVIPDPVLSYLYAAILSVFWVSFGRWIQLKIQAPLQARFLPNHYEVEQVVKSISERLFIANSRLDVVNAVTEEFSKNIQIKFIFSILALKNEDHEVMKYRCQQIRLYPGELIKPKAIFHPGSDFIDYFSSRVDICEFADLPDHVKKDFPFSVDKDSICIPLHSDKALQGVFILGPKRSGEEYTKKDKALFASIASQVLFIFDRIHQQKKLKKLQGNR